MHRDKYTVLNFINDIIYFCASMAVMMSAVLAGVSIWAIYRPQIRTAIREIQNIIFYYIGIRSIILFLLGCVVYQAVMNMREWYLKQKINDIDTI
ncbi:MAG: hypothetical protein ABFD79_02765, partial [Phycisphaerales bacterium]